MAQSSGDLPPLPTTAYDSPARLNGLEPLLPGTQYSIAQFGAYEGYGEVESLTIIAGKDPGRDPHGAAQQYHPDTDIAITRIFDTSQFPLTVRTGDDQAISVNFMALSYRDDVSASEAVRAPVVTPLLPGRRHLITNRSGIVVGDFGIAEAGGFTVVRDNRPESAQAHIRLIGSTDQAAHYVQREAVTPCTHDVSFAIGAVTMTNLGSRDIVLQRGRLEIVTAAGEAVTAVLGHRMMIQRGYPGRFESFVASVLFEQQAVANATRLQRPIGPDTRYMRPPY